METPIRPPSPASPPPPIIHRQSHLELAILLDGHLRLFSPCFNSSEYEAAAEKGGASLHQPLLDTLRPRQETDCLLFARMNIVLAAAAAARKEL